MNFVIYTILGLYGLLAGSFLNAWIWRIYTHRKISRGRSMCPHCKHSLAWYDLIPVVSWLLLLGRCRYCKRGISVQYPLVELATGLLWVGLAFVIQPNTAQAWTQLIAWLIVGTLLIAAFVYDAKWMLLPDQFMIPAIVVGILWNIALWLFFGQPRLAITQVLGALLFAGFFFAMWYLSRGRWLGDGDIRLALIMGLMLSSQQLIVAIFMTYFIGAIVSVILLATKLKTRKDPIAFGPFLIIGMFIAFFLGDRLIMAYLSFFS